MGEKECPASDCAKARRWRIDKAVLLKMIFPILSTSLLCMQQIHTVRVKQFGNAHLGKQKMRPTYNPHIFPAYCSPPVQRGGNDTSDSHIPIPSSLCNLSLLGVIRPSLYSQHFIFLVTSLEENWANETRQITDLEEAKLKSFQNIFNIFIHKDQHHPD